MIQPISTVTKSFWFCFVQAILVALCPLSPQLKNRFAGLSSKTKTHIHTYLQETRENIGGRGATQAGQLNVNIATHVQQRRKRLLPPPTARPPTRPPRPRVRECRKSRDSCLLSLHHSFFTFATIRASATAARATLNAIPIRDQSQISVTGDWCA